MRKRRQQSKFLIFVTGIFTAFAAAVLAASLLAQDVQAAAPGTPQYIQAVNRAIMYTEGVYADGETEPMSLAEAIACAYADAKPASVGKAYAAQGNYQPRSETTAYTWNGANITSRVDQDAGSDYKTQWNYTWDAQGYLSRLSQVSQYRYFTSSNSKGASISIQLGADGRPAAMNAPMVYPWYADHQQRLYAFAYDAAGRITAMSSNVTDSSNGQTTTVVYNYTYNADGTLKMVSNSEKNHFLVFHYDPAGRLAMSFDEAVNAGYGGGDEAVAYSYDAANRPLAAVGYTGGQLSYQKSYNYH